MHIKPRPNSAYLLKLCYLWKILLYGVKIQSDSQGHPHLVKILAKFFGRILSREIDPMQEVLVSVGAYGTLFCAFQALVDEGDEVSLSVIFIMDWAFYLFCLYISLIL